MAQALVIVESPTKAKKIGEYLGPDFVVMSSVGHVRDLPLKASDLPAALRGESWARLGVNVEADFKPVYVVHPNKRDVIRDLKAALRDAEQLYLATDEDREGEAIAWHLLEELNPRVPVHRMVFHEITAKAIREAVEHPRDLDRRLVDAQETRRILDRLYGFEVSPVVWKKVQAGLSAGRVQSVATRLVVQRERERIAFTSASYWDLQGSFTATEGAPEEEAFTATLSAVEGTTVAGGSDFAADGKIAEGKRVLVLDEQQASALAAGLAGADFAVRSVTAKPRKKRPAAPFTTSSFQQACGGRLRLSASQAMQSAQRLYESGYITYMRTDSTTLSADALSAARREISERFGAAFLPAQPRVYASKSKNAQEAHEAIRPAGETFRHPDAVARELTPTDAKVYELIWRRTVASQMVDADQEQTTVLLGATTSDGRDAELKATGTVTTFPGWLAVFDDRPDDETALPALTQGQAVFAREIEAQGHATSPPARFTEASLVKKLEEEGVGRPSTYASIIQTIQDRGYVWKKGQALVPTWTAFAVVNLLERHFGDLVDYSFTARMEDDLDAIARGEQEMVPWLSHFYFGGDGDPGLRRLVTDHVDQIDAAAVNSFPLGLDADGTEIVAKPGKFGPYVKRGEDTASIPDDLPPDELTVEKAVELLSQPRDGRPLGTDPATGLTVVARPGRFGPYVAVGTAEELGDEKPKTASLFKTMTVETVTLEEALRLLSLPRQVGAHPDDGEVIEALNGRYGPYLKKGGDSRSLETEEQLFTVTLEEAVRILAQPKRRRGQAPAAPLRELGNDPVSGQQVVVKEGRFGPYVTDGETNASLRKGDAVEEITIERAAELLEIRRQNPPKGRAKRKAPAKKKAAAKRKAPAKKKAAAKRKAAAAQQAPAAGEPAPSAAGPAPDGE